MRVTILAVGSRGDVQPYVALGKGLQQAGYRVRIGMPENFKSLAAEHRLDFVAISPSSQQIMAGPFGKATITSGENNFAFVMNLAKMLGEHAQESLQIALQACSDADVIVFNHFAWMGFHIAEKLDIPAVAAWIYPLNRTRDFPPLGTPPWLQLGRPFNRQSYVFYEQLIQYAFSGIFSKWRRTLELPPLPRGGIFSHFYQRKIPVLYAYSPNVVPVPNDWPERYVVTGYWFLDRPSEWQPSADLSNFLADGPPPVYIGFGSMSGDHPQELTDMAIDILKQTGQRGILARGWGGLDVSTANHLLTADIFVVDEAPHDWLFPQTAAVVHHGGAGTTSAGLRAGVPSILVPFSGDQPFWGQRVTALGVGPAAIPYKKLSARRLSSAINTAIRDEALQRRAAALGQQIRSEDGIASAVAAFENFCRSV
jgi:UDP:flavonoid glycosyltransferase YjiC (YdhE family)